MRTGVADEDMLVKVRHSESGNLRVDMFDLEL